MRGTRPRLVTIGDLTLDVVVHADAGVEVGTDVPSSVAFRAGGSAANTARAFSRLGGVAVFMGAVGTDAVGRAAAAFLGSEGVRARVIRRPGKTARLIVLVSESGERSFLTDRGVADQFPPSALEDPQVAVADALHLPAYSLLKKPLASTALKAARVARKAGALVSVDLASRRPLMAGGPAAARARIVAVRADVLFANHEEAGALVGQHSLRALLELAPVAVVKAGAAGCEVMWANGQIVVRARPMKVTDTTGAGDAFDAGFLYSLISTGRAIDALRSIDLRHAAYDGQKAAAAFIRGKRVELAL